MLLKSKNIQASLVNNTIKMLKSSTKLNEIIHKKGLDLIKDPVHNKGN